MTIERPTHEERAMIDQTPQPPGGTYELAGRRVARIGYGAMQLERAAAADAGPERQAGVDLLREAVALGIDHIDTAAFYGTETVNGLIREALAPYPDELVIASKIGAVRETGPEAALVAAQRPEELRAGVHADLRSLGVERVDLVNLRRLDRPPGITASGEQLVALDDQLAELVAMRDEGLIGAIGLSSVSEQQLAQALPAGIACVQNAYSLVDRSDESLLELCREHGIAWIPFIPLGSAFPGYPKVVEQPAVIEAASRLQTTPALVGLAWLLGHAPNVLLIPGTASLEHLRDNLTAGRLALPDDVTAALDGLVPSSA